MIDAIHTFLENGYSLSFIFSIIEKRLKFHTFINTNTTHNLQIKEKYFTIPYVHSISESFLPTFNMFHCKLVIFTITYTLKNLLKEVRISWNCFRIKIL